MKNQKHTPGPWTAFLVNEPLCMNGIGIGQVNGPKGIIANCEESTHEETMANATLISAAPEMLKALETICDECTDLSFDQLCLVKNAIRKARGE